MNQSSQNLLAALIRGPGYGVELAERVKTATNGRYEIGPATLYPALRDLETEGLVRSWEEQGPAVRAGRPRKYYELTAKGKMVALAERNAVVGLWGLLVPGAAT
jgi:PadR family transcriptional regulator PadR